MYRSITSTSTRLQLYRYKSALRLGGHSTSSLQCTPVLVPGTIVRCCSPKKGQTGEFHAFRVIGYHLTVADKHISPESYEQTTSRQQQASSTHINLTMFSAAIRNQFRRATVQTVRSASSSSHPKPLIPASILSRWYAT